MNLNQAKAAIAQPPPPELADLADWLEEFQSDAWDRQIALDVKAGKFEAVLQRVDEQAEASRVDWHWKCQPTCVMPIVL